eukprot:CAMPEP_0174926870 /NCGR_PEP_ID=MMETSP1355-20121228/15682_1 /TAXON_ID=464990 /ORGANISM="Hemiselmis tepida, Strain CCMP443" /LENGTH=71 /DNA_ID=CAMNT_0016172937 /DNA_START=31 /DNA_END=246 /DNA_ORIENTATION=-
MFSILRSMLLESPAVLYTHVNLDNATSTKYPEPGYFTTTPTSISMNSATYNGQDSECSDGPASGMGQNMCH